MYTEVSDILLWMVYDISRFGMILMQFAVLNSICPSFSHCSSNGISDWKACLSVPVVMLFMSSQSSENRLVGKGEECTKCLTTVHAVGHSRRDLM